MQSKGPRRHELEALAAHDATIEVGVKSQRQRAMLLEAQHCVILEVTIVILVFSFNVVKGKEPVVLQCLLLCSGGGHHGCIKQEQKLSTQPNIEYKLHC